LIPLISRAGEWFLHSGIQEPNGGVARYRRVDLGRNQAVSTEITGYAASTFVFLHSLTHDERYLDAASRAAEFLARTAWDGAGGAMPFELDPSRFTYFFDCGIIVRGLLAVWRATGREEFRECAARVGWSMARDFSSGNGDLHPVLLLPEKRPAERDAARWSQSAGCYQLKSAMAWYDLAEASDDAAPRRLYEHTLEHALAGYEAYLPGDPERAGVMDRLHPFLYFLEGLLPAAGEARCVAAIRDGIARTAGYLREIAPEFARSDVYAQLLRIRLHAAAVGAVPLDRAAAQEEAAALESFQRENGCFSFGRKAGVLMPYDNPVSTGFALQALALWHGCAPPLRHLLI
jgi:hypothetical protein